MKEGKGCRLELCPEIRLIWHFRTGRVAFDAMGDRVFAEYKIINIRRDSGNGARTKLVTVGNFSYNNVTPDRGDERLKF